MDIFLIILVIVVCLAIYFKDSIFGKGEIFGGGPKAVPPLEEVGDDVEEPSCCGDTEPETDLEKEKEAPEEDVKETEIPEGRAAAEANRTKLPYRPVAECYLVHDGKLIAQDHGHYIMYPGGGIDDGETPEEAGKREVEEEVGIKLDGELTPITTVEWDWMPEWANNDKRKARYEQFRGERVHFMIGKIASIKKATSKEGDAWKGDISMDFDTALKLHDKHCQTDHPNTKCYRSVQKAMINMVKLQNSKPSKTPKK